MDMLSSSSSNRERMIVGALYNAGDPELLQMRRQTRHVIARYNATAPDDPALREALLRGMLRTVGDRVEIEPPFQCDYGWNIELGSDVYFNFGCIILDCARVTVGSNVKFGPGVHLYAATHPTDPAVRRAALEYALPIRVGDCVWVGGGTLILPGVSIGENTTVGAGSVVTRNLPPNVIAVEIRVGCCARPHPNRK
jgi:maltose O-acetyltransferase